MKKKMAVMLLAVALAAVSISGCGSKAATDIEKEEEQKENPVDINITALKGPTAMGMVQFMDEAEQGKLTDENYQFSIAASADEVSPKLVQGETDIAAVPANLASVLYNKTEGKVQVLAVNTLGVLYLLENGNSVQSVADLKGKPFMPAARALHRSMPWIIFCLQTELTRKKA